MKLLAVGAAVFVAALFLTAQLLLPGYAEDRLRDDLTGEIRRVEVQAMPAIKLLLGRADRVEVEMGEVRTGRRDLADLLARTADTDELEAKAAVLRVGPFVARDARMTKRGDALRGEAAVRTDELTAALPVEIGLRPVESADGQLVLEATAGAIAVRARLSARDGALVIAPEGLLGGFAALTIFSDPRVQVRGVGARPATAGFVLTAEATVSG